ncbi:MAG: family 16 glycosylhydrolase [Spirochaetia bacterium]|nr:family 16 glycosylhydrolase [Spirochaetia bacterium]
MKKGFILTCIVFITLASCASDRITLNIDERNLLGNAEFSAALADVPPPRDDGAYDTRHNWMMLLFDGAQAEYQQKNDALHIDITHGGPNTWSVQVLQAPIEIQQGQKYRVDFIAWADTRREIEVKIGGSAGREWTPYNPGQGGDAGGTMVQLSDKPQAHSFTFTMLHETDVNARFEFELGRETGDIRLSAASLVPVGEVDLALGQEEIDMDSYLAREWALNFAEEFDGEEINTDIWSFEIGNGHANGIPGWGNAERQYYTSELENAFIRDGHLVIRAREDSRSDQFGEYDYTSARMISQDKFTVQYGRIDVRAKMPRGQGIWPAIWMLGESISDVGWPQSGEIDIMEMLGQHPSVVHGTVHGPGYSGGGGISGACEIDSSFADDFHVFSIIWDKDLIIWLVDGEPYHQVTSEYVQRFSNGEWVFNQKFFFILNVAVGGHWPGYPDNTTVFPQEMEVDYIRVYSAAE